MAITGQFAQTRIPTSPRGDGIQPHGIHFEDGIGGVMQEAKLVIAPGRGAALEGQATWLQEDFDDQTRRQLHRYLGLVGDPDVPLNRIDYYTSTQAAQAYLTDLFADIIHDFRDTRGYDPDVRITHRPWEQ